MPFTPRTATEIAQSWLAKMLARTKLTDVVEGSSLYWEAVTTAEEIAKAEYRLWQVRNGFFIQNPDIPSDMLRERGGELPVNAVPPLGRSAASGTVMSIYRASALAPQVLPAGTLFKRADGSQLTYKTIVDYTFNVGVIGLSDIYVVCTEQGTQGNVGAGIISSAVNAPDWVISAVNTKPLTNGIEAETDGQYQARLVLYLSSLAKSQRSAMEFLALSYQALDGSRCRFAKCYTDYTTPGYSELVVDDGTGMGGLVQPGITVSGLVPTGGQTMLVHPGPAAAEITKLTVVRGGLTLTLTKGLDFFSFPELGFIYVPAGGPNALQAGDTWTISDYSVYSGVLAELQSQVNGDPSNPVANPGWRAEGVRVRVVAPTVLPVTLDLHVVSADGVSLALVQSQVQNAALEFINSLGPGQPLYLSQLVGLLTSNPNVLNVKVFVKGTTTWKDDMYPAPREVLRATLSDIGFLAGM